jgi:hypothetical protein
MTTLLLAAGLLATGMTAASAQYAPYSRNAFPYAQKYHSVCQQKSHRLHDFERRAASDGRISRSERATMAGLKRDLARTCGGYRFRG